MATRRIQILAIPSVFDSAFFIVRDTLVSAARIAGDGHSTVEVVTLDGRTVRSASGQSIRPERAAQRTRPDLVVVPGFSVGEDPSDVLRYLTRTPIRRIVRWLGAQYARGATLATGCTGAWLVAEAGVLEGQEATTTWYLAQAFRERFPGVRLVESKMLTRAERVLCSGAAMAHMDLALSIVGTAFDADTSRRVAAALLLDQRPSQAHFMITDFMAERSGELRVIDTWIRDNLHEGLSTEDLAAAVHLSPRTLARRVKAASGLSPGRYVQRIRVEEAARLLRTTDLSAAEVARRVGYGDAATLRRLTKRALGRTPSELR